MEKGFAANNAERAEVCVIGAEEKLHEAGGEPVAEGLLRGEGAGFMGGEDAGTEDEVGLVVEDGSEELREIGRVVAAVGIEEDDDFDVGGERGDAREACLAVAAAGFENDTGAVLGGERGSGIGGTVVDDEDFGVLAAGEREDRAEGVQGGADGVLFVEGGDEKGNGRGHKKNRNEGRGVSTEQERGKR